MANWRQLGAIWQLRPAEPTGLIEFIGGSYLAATPQISYRRLLEELAADGLAVHAWAYVPGFDHQRQARDAWSAFRSARRQLEERCGTFGAPLRLGGRGSRALVALSFNNFNADRSIPLLGELAPRLGVETEFSPSPAETLRLISRHYQQERNLVVRFGRDELDQSGDLIQALRERASDASSTLELPGDHLTPASAGLRRSFLGDWADDPRRVAVIRQLSRTIGQAIRP